MGKLASFVRNSLLTSIVLLLAHLSYRLYEMTLKLVITCDKIEEMNNLVRDLHELIKNIKFSLF